MSMHNTLFLSCTCKINHIFSQSMPHYLFLSDSFTDSKNVLEKMGLTLCSLFLSRARVRSIILFSGNPRRSARRRPATAATQFKISLGALLNNLGTKMPHYVRCLKANDAKQPKLFDSSLVKHQVTYQG